MAKSFGLSNLNEVIPGIISSVSSFSVCLTYAMFPELRSLRYIELVFYVSINDFIASIAISLGYSPSGSAACWFQGIATTYNFLAAILWTTIITFQVYMVVCHQNVIKDLTYAHVICWGLPLIATLLPLSTNTYAVPDDESNWCFVADRSDSPKWGEIVWFVLSFYGWIWLAMLFNIVFVVAIVYRFYQMQDVPDRVVSTIRKLLLYPIIISFCWSMSTFTDLYSTVYDGTFSSSFYIVDGVATILAVSQGFLFAVVFFGFNPLVRKAWLDLFRKMGLLKPEKMDQPRDRDDKSISMVSVSIHGTSTSDANGSRDTMAIERENRRSSTGGFMHSSITSMNSWYIHPKDSMRVQEEMDYMYSPEEERLSQRLSELAHNLGGPVSSSSLFRNSDLTPHAASRQSDLGVTMNPMSNPQSVAVNDFNSTTSASQSGRTTPQSRRGDRFSFDEETGTVQSTQSGMTGTTSLTASTALGDDTRNDVQFVGDGEVTGSVEI